MGEEAHIDFEVLAGFHPGAGGADAGGGGGEGARAAVGAGVGGGARDGVAPGGDVPPAGRWWSWRAPARGLGTGAVLIEMICFCVRVWWSHSLAFYFGARLALGLSPFILVTTFALSLGHPLSIHLAPLNCLSSTTPLLLRALSLFSSYLCTRFRWCLVPCILLAAGFLGCLRSSCVAGPRFRLSSVSLL